MRTIHIIYLFVALGYGCGPGVHSDPDVIARCDVPDGSAHLVTSNNEDIAPLIIGTWLRCFGPPMLASEEVAIEFVAEGQMYSVLVHDDNGSLVRKVGFDGDGQWVAARHETGVYLNLFTPGGTLEVFLDFEDGPRKLRTRLQATPASPRSVYVVIP